MGGNWGWAIAVLAVAGEAALDALKLAGAAALDGKTVIDACNPIGGGPPVNGVLSFFTTLKDSLMERLQKAFPSAHFVKAFNSVGNAQMVNPHFAGGRPTMFICGNDAGAKRVVTQILDQFGWDTEDMGAVEAARAIRKGLHRAYHRPPETMLGRGLKRFILLPAVRPVTTAVQESSAYPGSGAPRIVLLGVGLSRRGQTQPRLAIPG